MEAKFIIYFKVGVNLKILYSDKSSIKFGLRYDDCYDPYYDVDVKEALNRLPREVVDVRHQRSKRAMDLSMKHEYLSEELHAIYSKEQYNDSKVTGIINDSKEQYSNCCAGIINDSKPK
ncbi:hypothetical protein ACFE04_021287 [Oxalis oulophora]